MQAIPRAVLTACAITMAGCAFSPPSFRVVPARAEGPPLGQLKAFEVLAPGVQRVKTRAGQDAYVMDIPLTQSPWRCLGSGAEFGKISANIRMGGTDGVLRVTTSRHATSAELRQGWSEWTMSPAGKAVAECLSAADLESMPDRLEAARPVDGEGSLEAVFGLSDKTPVVLLRPGMNVCATDAFMRNPTVSTFVPSGPLCARVARSPAGGYVLDPVRHSLRNITDRPTDQAVSTVTKIASWSEVPKETAAVQYLVRYPTRLPVPSENTRPHEVSLLISLANGIKPEVRQAALQCIADPTRLLNFCQVAKEEIPDRCGNPLLKLEVKPQCYRFGERGVMNISMPVVINGSSTDVDVGALAGDAAARLGRASAAAPTVMMRWHGGKLHPVKFESEDKRSLFDLPLLPGDQLSW